MTSNQSNQSIINNEVSNEFPQKLKEPETTTSMSIKMTSNKQNNTTTDEATTEPMTIDIDKLEATFGKGSVRSVSHLGGDTNVEIGDDNIPKNYNGDPIHFKYYRFALLTNGKQGILDLQKSKNVFDFTKYVVDKYPDWDTNNSWKDDAALVMINKQINEKEAAETAPKKKKLKLKIKKPEPDIIPLTFNKTTRLGECGLQEETNKLYIPFFLMGACGVDEAAISWDGDREVMPLPKKLNLIWFKKVADRLEKHPYWDWDWVSFKNNILKPNREHIKQVLNINDDKVDTLLCDGFVFINNFSKDWADEGEEYVEDFNNGEVGHYPNFTNFLKHDNLEY
tara:strand:- start:2323 stop:3336 length:1014 start_codon:yes stop_codon:yes gene_type:complete